MAIAFRSVGATSKVDVSATGQPSVSVALPAGHVAGDTLVMYVLTDGNSNTTAIPSGWTQLSYITNGTSVRTPYTPYMQLRVLYRIDSGSLGSSVALSFNTAAWPAGSPFVLAFIAAYSGCDPANPIEKHASTAGSLGSTALTHPQMTTATTGDWLLTYCCASSDAPAATFTSSVGTDAERVDDSEGSEIACALYDSNAGLIAGTQTQRVTTSSRAATYGSMGYSLVLKAPASGTAAVAAPPEAAVAVTAYNPAVTAQDGPWDLCGTNGLPQYQFAIDWDGSGLNYPGQRLANPNAYFRSGVSGYVVSGGGVALAWETSLFKNAYGVNALRLTPDGVSASGSADQSPPTPVGSVVPGRSYLAEMWAYSPTGVGNVQAAAHWYDANGTFLSSGLGAGVTLSAGVWTRVSQTLTAPASASRAAVRARHSGTPPASAVWYVWGLTLSDPALPGTYVNPGPGEDVTQAIVSDISFTYGRDQERQLSPGAVGSASFTLSNANRTYSPENSGSAMSGNIDPARTMRGQASWNGQTYSLLQGRVDDYTIKVDANDRTVDLTFLDGMNDLSGNSLSTGVYASQRTGSLVNTVLDEAGWTGGRDIDPGATVVKYWWVDGTDALTAINDLVKSEGPPAVAYVDPSGTFVFRDRHHRLLRQNSRNEQAYFHAGALGNCTPAGVPQGALSLARPFVYAHGWKDIVNSVTFDVPDRAPSAGVQQVWQDTTTYTLSLGQSLDLTVSSSDPFVNAITPVLGTDVIFTGAGTVGVLLSRTSGASARLTLQAIGGTVTITSVQVRAQLLSVQQTFRVSMADTGSITLHGERTYPNDAPWAGPQDAQAIANTVLLHYATRRPTVQIRIVSSDPAHFVQVLSRTVSDRVRIANEEIGLDDDFFVERVTHTVQRIGAAGRPPVHAVILGCEKDLDVAANPFTFDVRGAGFDQGVFDPLTADDASQVFVFDDPVQGQFDSGEFGT